MGAKLVEVSITRRGQGATEYRLKSPRIAKLMQTWANGHTTTRHGVTFYTASLPYPLDRLQHEADSPMYDLCDLSWLAAVDVGSDDGLKITLPHPVTQQMANEHLSRLRDYAIKLLTEYVAPVDAQLVLTARDTTEAQP